MKTLLAILAIVAPLATAAPPSLDPGQPFPVLSLPLCGNEEERDSIMKYRGRKLMLHLFASW